MHEWPNNNTRAGWAEQTLGYFMSITGVEWEDALCDLLCDLMHLADRTDEWCSFDDELQRARNHYVAELREEDERRGR